jgi:hypothetical protein
MKGRLLLMAAVFLFLVGAREASACSKCAISGVVCYADDCILQMYCKDASFGTLAWADCQIDLRTGNCTTGSDFCRWTFNRVPEALKPAPMCHATPS